MPINAVDKKTGLGPAWNQNYGSDESVAGTFGFGNMKAAA
jgi:hypothetical protein